MRGAGGWIGQYNTYLNNMYYVALRQYVLNDTFLHKNSPSSKSTLSRILLKINVTIGNKN